MYESKNTNEPVGRESRRRLAIESRKADALAAASLVFAEKGFHDAQVAEIADAAELSLATLYSCFGGKEDLYREVVRGTALRIRDGVRGRVDAVDGPREKLLTVVDALLECFEQDRTTVQTLLSGTFGFPWRIQEKLRDSSDLLQDFRAWVVELSRAAVESDPRCDVAPKSLAAVIIGGVTTSVAWALESDDPAALRASAKPLRLVVERILGDAS